MVRFVGVGDCQLANEPGQILKTMALGSCIAVIGISRKNGAVGLLHLQLPESSINPALSQKRPAMFADTGIAMLLQEFSRLGVSPRDLAVKLVGGAQVLDPNQTFNIGKRNYLAAKKVLWANRLWPVAEDIGGTISRTVSIAAGTDRVHISSPGKEDWTI